MKESKQSKQEKYRLSDPTAKFFKSEGGYRPSDLLKRDRTRWLRVSDLPVLMTPKAAAKKRPRSKSTTTVSPATEWTGFAGMNELFGMRRTTCYHVFETEPMLKGASISLKGPNEVRGIRLFNVKRFRAFLESRQNGGSQ